jgi:hypothetical protein
MTSAASFYRIPSGPYPQIHVKENVIVTHKAVTDNGADAILLLEYERSSEFCNHVDGVRNVITSFFLTVVGGTVFVVDKFASGDIKPGPLGSPGARVIVLLGFVSAIGMIFVMVIARLRRVQLERYSIMNAILDRLVPPADRIIIPFRDSTIAGRSTASPLGRRTTGSYFWTLIIVLPSATLLGIAAALICENLSAPILVRALVGAAVWLGYLALSDLLYFRLS